MCKMVFPTILAISPPILICFGCSKAHFLGGGYRNLYLYLYPPVPYPQPVWVPKPLINPTREIPLLSKILTNYPLISMFKSIVEVNKNQPHSPYSYLFCFSYSRVHIELVILGWVNKLKSMHSPCLRPLGYLMMFSRRGRHMKLWSNSSYTSYCHFFEKFTCTTWKN